MASAAEIVVTSGLELAEGAKLERRVRPPVKARCYVFLRICRSLFDKHPETRSLIAGAVAGGVSRSIVAPLERLKILRQVQKNIKYNGTVSGLNHIWRAEGFRGLFKGNGTNCARVLPFSAVKFFSYEEVSRCMLHQYRQRNGNEDAQLTPLLRLVARACAGTIAMTATYPLDVVRGRLTVQTEKTRQYRGMFRALSTVIQTEGPRALYKGWLPAVLGVAPYVGVNFAAYESLKDWLMTSNPFGIVDNSELSITHNLACGCVAGALGQTVTYPLDVIRRRMQMVGWKDGASIMTDDGKKVAFEYTGMIDAFRKTVRYEGYTALYKGLVLNTLKAGPSVAVAFVAYENMKDILGADLRFIP